MAFTKRTITHSFKEPSGAAASGSVEFSLTHRITNGTETLVPGSITAALNSSGELSQELTSNQDTGTVPGDSQWRVDFRITNSPVETFFIVVAPGPGSTDLGSLLPKEPLGG